MNNNTPTQKQSETLKPCPFCGGKAEHFECEETDNMGGQVIGCKECHASTKVFFGNCVGLLDAWNTRPAKAVQGDKLLDRYGLALMMIKEGVKDPSKFAAEILEGAKSYDTNPPSK